MGLFSRNDAGPSFRRRPWVRRLAGISLALTVLVGTLAAYVLTSHRSIVPDWLERPIRRAMMLIPSERVQALITDELPKPAVIERARWLDQGWSNAQRFWFHHTSQGTTLPIPYDWLVALQQPGFSFTGASNLLRDPEYMRQFGFITSPRTLQTAGGPLREKYGYADEQLAERVRAALKRHASNVYTMTRGGAATAAVEWARQRMAKDLAENAPVTWTKEDEGPGTREDLVKHAIIVFAIYELQELGIWRDELDDLSVTLAERERLDRRLENTGMSGARLLIKTAVDDIVSEVYGDLTTRQLGSTVLPKNLQRRMPENVDGLPVGFARTPGFLHPTTGKPLPDQVGFSCAACHTAELQYKGVSLRIDGGAANVNLLAFQKAFVQAMIYTQKIPGRFSAFADRVLGERRSQNETARLREEFDFTLGEIIAAKRLQDGVIASRVAARAAKDGTKASESEKHVEEGFARLDALNRIGNQVFFTNLLPSGNRDGVIALFRQERSKALLKIDIRDNFVRHSAPVSFPPIWNTSWHLWAQYDASIMQPVIRNLGEALGVAAKINMINRNWSLPEESPDSAPSPQKDRPLFRSSVDLQDLHDIEVQLAGCKDAFPVKLVASEQRTAAHPCTDPDTGAPGFKGLQAPRWSDAAKLFELRSDADKRDPAKLAAADAWRIDPKKVDAGRRIYVEICAECHLPPVRDPGYKELIAELNEKGAKPTLYDLWDPATVYYASRKGSQSADYRQGIDNLSREPVVPQPIDPEGRRTRPPTYWLQLSSKRYLDVVQKPSAELGTDPALSHVLAGRKIHVPRVFRLNPNQDMDQWNCRQSLPGPSQTYGFGIALMAIVDKTAQQWLEDRYKYGTSWGAEQKSDLQHFLGDRPSCPNPLVEPEAGQRALAQPQYRARSLDGIWATAPYLHNGSVPNLWTLLSPNPEKDRAAKFCVGSKEFDPKRVGLEAECKPGMTLLDTSIPGNSRMGHELRGEKPRQVPSKGVVGRALSEDERWQLIEYLKTL